MDELRKQLEALDADQVKQLLSASGHEKLLQTVQAKAQEPVSTTVDVAALKAQGNALFKQGQYDEAARIYTICIENGGKTDATLYSNRAMAFLKLQQYDRVIADCTRALTLTPSIKPCLRRATAYVALGDPSSAVQDLDTALSFDASNKEALRLLEQIAKDKEYARSTRIRAILLVSFRNGWKTMSVKGNPAPPCLNGHALFSIPSDPQQRVFLYGGRAVRDQKSHVYVMDEHDYSWDLVTTHGSLPAPRAWHCVCPLGDNVLGVYGGVSASAEDPSVHLLHATPSPGGYNLTWQQSAMAASTAQAPLPRSGHASIDVVEVDGSRTVVMFGGRTKRGVTDEMWTMALNGTNVTMDRIDWSDDELVTAWPAARDGHSMVLWSTPTGQKYVLVFGGNGQQTEEKMNDLWQFDLTSRQRKEVTCSGEVPQPRSYHSAHIVGDFMIIIGGRMLDAEDGDVYVLDLDAMEWFRVRIPADKVMTPCAWHASIYRSFQNEIYLLGSFHGSSREAAVLDLSKFQELIKSLRHLKGGREQDANFTPSAKLDNVNGLLYSMYSHPFLTINGDTLTTYEREDNGAS